MCGICGFFQSDSSADKAVLKLMNDQIIHRGPDDDGYYFNQKVGLAARRLAIIDLKTGHQPLKSHSGNSWITYNGEIYNFKELRLDLENKGYIFHTKTDTEVIVNLYEEYGLDCVNKLRGMFAFGIFDLKLNRLLLARDHVGIKPLYYSILPDTGALVFGSELKSILKYPGIKRDLNETALDLFLTLEYIPAPHSIFSNIYKLPAGHLLVFDNNSTVIKKYWEVKPGTCNQEFSSLKEQFHHLLDESVKMRLLSDVPLGAFLSGGIDSSAIVSTMARFSDQPVKTFSIGFEEKSYSELKYSYTVSQKFNTDHYTKNLSPNINDLVLFLADILDEPLGDFSNFPTYLVSQTAREKVTVVLSGDGGDEIFGGYEHYIAQKISKTIDFALFRPFHKIFAKSSSLFPPSDKKKGFINRIKRYSEGFENPWQDRHFRWMLFLSNHQKTKLYSEDFLHTSYLRNISERAPYKEYFTYSKTFPGINQDLFLDLKTYLVDDILVKVDRMSMATSLEARVPLLDYKMVEFAFSLPPQYKLNGSTSKWFFKKAMEGILPQEIIYRQKEGFSIPIKNWLRYELKDLMYEYLSDKRIKELGLFNIKYVNNMKTEHIKNRANHSHRLWPLILFNLWKERYWDA